MDYDSRLDTTAKEDAYMDFVDEVYNLDDEDLTLRWLNNVPHYQNDEDISSKLSKNDREQMIQDVCDCYA